MAGKRKEYLKKSYAFSKLKCRTKHKVAKWQEGRPARVHPNSSPKKLLQCLGD